MEDQLIIQLRRMAMSMQVHPDCQPNSEFADFVSGAWELIEQYEKQNHEKKT